jgi:Tfp pilus assembly protein PilO
VGSLSRRERSLIGLGVAAAALVAAYLYGVEPWLTRQRATAELTATREATLERRRLLIAQRDRLSAEKAVLATRLEDGTARLLAGPTPPLAAAELQRMAKEAATAASVEVRSERVLPTIDLGGLLEVPIELTVAGTVRETATLFAHLDGAARLVTIKDVKIRLVAPGQPRDLTTTLTVSGYLRPS